MTELSPHEARLEAFKALVAPQPISTGTGATYYFTTRQAERSMAFVADLLGELAAAQATNSVLKLSRNELWKGLVKAADDIAFGLGERTKLEQRAEAAEQEVARLKEFPALILRIGHNDECLFCGFKDREATEMEARHAG